MTSATRMKKVEGGKRGYGRAGREGSHSPGPGQRKYVRRSCLSWDLKERPENRIRVKEQPKHKNYEAEGSLTLEHSSVSQERYFLTTTIPTLRHNAARVRSTIKLDSKFHFFFLFFSLRLGGRCGRTRRWFAIKLKSTNYHFVPDLNLY